MGNERGGHPEGAVEISFGCPWQGIQTGLMALAFGQNQLSRNCLLESGLGAQHSGPSPAPHCATLLRESVDLRSPDRSGNKCCSSFPGVGSAHLCFGDPVASAVLCGLSPGTQGVTDIFWGESRKITGRLLRHLLTGLSRCP